MKRLMFNILCLVVFLAGLATYSRTKSTDVEVARSYVVIMEHFRISANGSRRELASRIIYAKANGEMRQTGYDPNNGQDLNREAQSVARLEEGLFATASRVAERNLISSTAVPPEMQQCFRSAACLRGNPRFVRTDEVAGLQVYVFHDNVPPPQPMEWIEQSYSPKTGFLELRKVWHYRDGSEDVLQATSVEFKNVPSDLNDDIRSMPVKNP
jgi:hypothetical protein